MTVDQSTPRARFRGLLECPLRKGYVEFEFNEGDPVRELLLRTEQVWGSPRTGMERELNQWGHFLENGQWLIFCEATDGTYVHLSHSDLIPTSPPPGGDDALLDNVEVWSRRHRLNWQGMVYAESTMKSQTRLKLHIERNVAALKDEGFDVRLVALVAIAGG